jgi:hypothetical protein
MRAKASAGVGTREPPSARLGDADMCWRAHGSSCAASIQSAPRPAGDADQPEAGCAASPGPAPVQHALKVVRVPPFRGAVFARIGLSLLLLQMVVMASAGSGLPAPGVERALPRPSRIPVAHPLAASWPRLELLPPCGLLMSGGLPCAPNRVVMEPVLPVGAFVISRLSLPRRSDHFKTLGGFVSLDLLASARLRSGPEFSWATPDSPREELPKLRLLSPGWRVSYAWKNSPVAVGLSTCSRFIMLGQEVPWFDAVTSEARLEVLLP